MRRAVRYVYTFLGQREAFLYKFVDTLVAQMGGAYPELPAQKELIKKVIKEEEDSSSALSTTVSECLTARSANSGPRALMKSLEAQMRSCFMTHMDLPLTSPNSILREQGMSVDKAGFD